MPRMRTIQEAIFALKEQDPHTAITAHFVRQLVVTGTFPSVKAGKKYLINLDSFFEFLAHPQPIKDEKEHGNIRRIRQ